MMKYWHSLKEFDPPAENQEERAERRAHYDLLLTTQIERDQQKELEEKWKEDHR